MDFISIKEMFIFNTKLKSPLPNPSDDEQQDAKLLYYYPNNVETLVKRSNIGIIEGTTSFMKEFQKTNTNFLLAELNKLYFLADNYEEDFTIGFILYKKTDILFNMHQNLETKKKWLKSFIDHFYNSFTLFHNTLKKFFISDEKPEINMSLPNEKLNILNDFIINYIEYMSTVKFPLIDNLQYFPMTSHQQSLLLLGFQRLKEKIKELKMISVIYQGKLIHNELPFRVMSLLFNIFYYSESCLEKFRYFKMPPYEVLQTLRLHVDLDAENTEKKRKRSDSFNCEEKLYSFVSSPYRKVFNLGDSKSEFLIGIKDISINNANIFIPNVYIRELDADFKFIVYYYNGLLFFFFIDKKFHVMNQISKIKKISKWIDKFFKEEIQKIMRTRVLVAENGLFCYTNNANKSIKLVNFVNKKNFQMDAKLFEILQKSLFINENNSTTSLTKYKGFFVYCIKSAGRRVIVFYKDSLSIQQLTKEIEKTNKENFQYIFLVP